jgi:hypothetical protein
MLESNPSRTARDYNNNINTHEYGKMLGSKCIAFITVFIKNTSVSTTFHVMF